MDIRLQQREQMRIRLERNDAPPDADHAGRSQ
jgi:hypothetical protein